MLNPTILKQILENLFFILLGIVVIYFLFHIFVRIYCRFTKNKVKDYQISEKKHPFISIHIPCFNDPIASRCVEKCLVFDYPKNKYEIIIVDDSTDIKTQNLLKKLAKHKIVKYIHRNNRSGFKAGALNNAMKITKGEIIVLFDADFLPEPNFLKEIIKPLKDKNVAIVQTKWKIYNLMENLVTIFGGTLMESAQDIVYTFMQRFHGIATFWGSAGAIRKSHLIKVGGWNETRITEDLDLSLRLLINGHKIVFLEKPICACETPSRLKSLCAQHYRCSYGVINASKKNFLSWIRTKDLSFRQKMGLFGLISGYVFSFIVLLFLLVSLLNFVISALVHPINWYYLIVPFGIIIISGLFMARNITSKHAVNLLISIFYVGLIVLVFESYGLIKALLDIPIGWAVTGKKGKND